MSESQEQLLSRIVAEAVEARQHPCNKCGHDGGKHAFDVFPAKPGPNPCYMSCKTCMENEFPEVKKK